MLWLYLALFAYFINAIAFIIDKHLLSSQVLKPAVYAFWVAVLSASAVVLTPFGVKVQGFEYLLIASVSGGSFFVALMFL